MELANFQRLTNNELAQNRFIKIHSLPIAAVLAIHAIHYW